MSAAKDMPQSVRPFNFFGSEMEPQPGGGDWVGDCRLCGKERHLYVEPKTGKWDCKTCGESGNVITFLTKVVERAAATTTRRDWVRIARKRGLPSGVLKSRGVGFDRALGAWLIPARGKRGTVHQVGVWREDGRGGTINVAGVPAALFGMDRLARLRPGSRVWLGEGWSDACALDWLTRDGGLRCDAAVALPGATTFKREWVAALAGHDVVLAFDADGAGERGESRAVRLLRGVARSLSFVRWPSGAPEGFDVRDLCCAARSAREATTEIEGLLRDTPRAASQSEMVACSPAGEGTSSAEAGASLDDVERAFERVVRLNDDMRTVLKVCLATALSTDIGGDPLWVYVVGPPSSGKTALLSPFQGSDRCVFRSTLTQHCLVSGFRLDGGADPSLIPRLSGRALVLKDFTEILSLPPPAQDEIFSTLRGAYDGHVVRTFGNGVERRYTASSQPPFSPFAMVAGVTNAIHAHGKANLGERFLKVQMRELTDVEQSDVNMTALASIGRGVRVEEEAQRAVASFLARTLDDLDSLPRWPDHLARRLSAMVTLIATLRAQVSRNRWTAEIDYRPRPEAGARLMKQLGKLGCALAWMRDAGEVGAEDYAIVDRVAMDTAYGFHLDVIGSMVALGGAATKAEIADAASLPQSTLSRRVDDLVLLGALGRTSDKHTGGRTAATFAVVDRIKALWREAREGETTCRSVNTRAASRGGHRRGRASRR